MSTVTPSRTAERGRCSTTRTSKSSGRLGTSSSARNIALRWLADSWVNTSEGA